MAGSAVTDPTTCRTYPRRAESDGGDEPATMGPSASYQQTNGNHMVKAGLRLLEETEGTGKAAAKGDTVQFESQAWLSGGDLAQDRIFMTVHLGKREVIAGVEYIRNRGLSRKQSNQPRARTSPERAVGSALDSPLHILWRK